MNIYFIKSLAYDVTLQGMYDPYEGYLRSTAQQTDPSLVSHVASKVYPRPSAAIYTSFQKRTIETALSVYGSAGIQTELLREVNFSIDQLVSKDEFSLYGSSLVRERFKELFINDALRESRHDLECRIENLLDLLMRCKKGSVYCVSHSFFMKILEAYIDTKKLLFIDPRLIEAYLPSEVQTYAYGQGFEISLIEEE